MAIMAITTSSSMRVKSRFVVTLTTSFLISDFQSQLHHIAEILICQDVKIEIIKNKIIRWPYY